MVKNQYRPQTEAVLKLRFQHNWRYDCYHSVVPPEWSGLTFPVYTSIAYGFSRADEAAAVFDGADGYGYPRIANKTPTIHKLEKALVNLELGEKCPWRGRYKAMVFASGINAIFTTMLCLADRGGSIVSSPYLYGGTYYLFANILPRLGIECFMIDNPLSIDSWRAGIVRAKNPVCLYAEDNANPMIVKLNNRQIARLAHFHNLPYVCDMTITTPFLEKPLTVVNPIERPDIIVHSLSKSLNGYSNCLGGAVIGRKELFEPFSSSIGLKEYFTYSGGVMDSRVAGVILQNLKDAKERILEKAANAILVASWLKKQPQVEKVFGPGGDLLSFQVRGGLEEARQVVENYKLIIFAPHLGDIRTLSIHPASTTHAKVPPEERVKMGITDNLIRLSVGLEDMSDIIDDLRQALSKAG